MAGSGFDSPHGQKINWNQPVQEKTKNKSLRSLIFHFFVFQRELRERMLSKIMLLREERDFLASEKLENDSFGQGITCLLEHYASPQEISKYHQFLEEIEQITKLTVGLTIRLGRLTRKIESGTKSREELVNILLKLVFAALDEPRRSSVEGDTTLPLRFPIQQIARST